MARKSHFVGIRESSSQNTLVGRQSDYKCVLARAFMYSYKYVCTYESTPSKLSVRVHVRVCDHFESTNATYHVALWIRWANKYSHPL